MGTLLPQQLSRANESHPGCSRPPRRCSSRHVDGFGGAVDGVGPVEVGEQVSGLIIRMVPAPEIHCNNTERRRHRHAKTSADPAPDPPRRPRPRHSTQIPIPIAYGLHEARTGCRQPPEPGPGPANRIHGSQTTVAHRVPFSDPFQGSSQLRV